MEISSVEARRIALAAQGFGRARPVSPTLDRVRKIAGRVLALQLDSVNVLVRSHYLPIYSRLGPYPVESLDRLAYRRNELFECWSHAACLLPVDLFPLMRHRMIIMETGRTYSLGRPVDGHDHVRAVYDEIAERGALTVGELSDGGGRTGKWWGWSKGKQALEALLECGQLAVAGRRGFTRVYDLVERVIPPEFLEAPAPPADEAQKELLYRSAAAVGITTGRGLRDYLGLTSFRIREPDGKIIKVPWQRLVGELVEEGRLTQVRVEGWRDPGYVAAGVRVPRTINARALLAPFDPFMRASAQLLCGFVNPIAKQLYVPAEQRVYGYYVLPFLLGDNLVGRCDLKADRQSGTLLVQSAYVEPGQDAPWVAAELAEELELLRTWLELDKIKISARGNLAADLRRVSRK
ncbi:winged helix-turn-helix domain-containing protein [Microlunatus sp. GCM10028923]|uniref:winged helix-turn-helix domain-containing protein n=1 Tax=Microlunatus sp. GCM10028923 TaxID=3273400 RepID=UPI00361E9DF1